MKDDDIDDIDIMMIQTFTDSLFIYDDTDYIAEHHEHQSIADYTCLFSLLIMYGFILFLIMTFID